MKVKVKSSGQLWSVVTADTEKDVLGQPLWSSTHCEAIARTINEGRLNVNYAFGDLNDYRI